MTVLNAFLIPAVLLALPTVKFVLMLKIINEFEKSGAEVKEMKILIEYI